jgi:hypothetical protein
VTPFATVFSLAQKKVGAEGEVRTVEGGYRNVKK